MFANLYERLKSYPNASLEELCAASSPSVRFEFHAEHEGVDYAFFSVDGYRVGTLISVRKDVADAAEMAQKILDDTVTGINKFVDNVGFQTSIMVVEKGKTREHIVK